MVELSDIAAIGVFSGCGGLDVGAHLAGVPVVAALDFDADCVQSLQANSSLDQTEVFHADIASFDLNEFRRVLSERSPDRWMLIGGPPCQPFSKAGYWVTHENRKIEDDPRNLVGAYLRTVREMQPDAFLFENVESILHPTNRHVVFGLIEQLKALGYEVQMHRVNAADYGVPQKRKRVFVVGTRGKFATEGPVRTHAPADDAEELGLLPYVGAGDVLRPYAGDEFAEPQEVVRGRYLADLLEVPPGRNYIALSASAGYPNPKFEAGKRFWSFLLKLSPTEPSWTIAAQPGPWVGPFHWESRRLRVPEIAALQTFPPEYVFVGSRRSVQRQIGNAVPCELGRIMVDYVRNTLQ